ncbi:MAG TPA: translocation/assembly module TamB domain-containing protein [Rhodanobacteraceae bacterium]
MRASTRRWLRRLGIAVGLLVVLLVIGLWWLLGTGSGLHFALARATAATNGTLVIGSAHGDLAGSVQLDGVDYRDTVSGIHVHVDQLKVDAALWSLLAGRVHLADLAARGITVNLATPGKPSLATSSPFSLKPPVDVVLDHVDIRNIHIIDDGKPAFTANALTMAGSWTGAGLSIRQLALHSPNGTADISGQLALAGHIHGKGQGRFRWTLNGTTWAGTLDATSDGRAATLALALSQPMAATAHVSLQQSGTFPWTARLDAPAFAAKPVLGDTSIKTLALALVGHGDRDGGTLNGRVSIDHTRLDLEPLEVRYNPHTQKITLDRLAMTSPDMPGQLDAHGTVDLAGQPVRANLALNWHGLVLPAQLAGQKLASAGAVTLTGSIQRYRLQGEITAGPPGQMAHLHVDLTGTPKLVTFDELTMQQPKGKLAATGTVTLQPELAWQLELTGQHVNPGLLLAGWNGALDIRLATRGRITRKGPDASIELDQLRGNLRQRNLSGHGKLHISPDRVLDGTLALTSGHSRIRLAASGKQSNQVRLDLTIISLNDWLPKASGALHGEVDLRGLWPHLAIKTHLRGRKLVVDERRVGALDLAANLPDLRHPGGTFKLNMDDLDLGQLAFQSVNLTGRGNAASHSLELVAKGQPLSLRLDLTGSLHGKTWNGTLSTLDLDLHGLPPWHLQQPAQLAWAKGLASLSSTCLTAGTPVLCVSAQQTRSGALVAGYQLQQIPLALITTAIGNGLPFSSVGILDGHGQLTRTPAGSWTGQAELSSPTGQIHYVDHPEQPLLAYKDFSVNATLTPQDSQVALAATFDQGGGVRGNIHLHGADQALSGHIALHMDSLKPVELFTSMLANVGGRLDADINLGGSLAQPTLQGRASLEQFAAEVPAVGLKLHDGTIHMTTANARQLRIDGQIASGGGTLKLAGTLGLGADAPTRLSIRGAKVLAADIPAATVTVSPDLTIDRDARGLAIGGTLTIDRADVKLEKLPGAGAAQASPDVVVVDAKKPLQSSAPLPIRANLTVDLGHHTHLTGYGLNGRVSGQLNVSQLPGKVTIGRGHIVINGTFKAYGQNLVIKQGRLLFASTPVDNPGLDIRAVRLLHPNATISDGQEVGLQISGTAQRPVMTVFSNPAMDQSDALSYLITGKPLSAVQGGQGDMVDAAAQALGSAAGDLLAKGIGAKLGIDASVSNSEALGTAAFTVGKYLSPRLYLSYGVGLFDPGQVITLRYILSSRWNFEAEQATTFSRASFNYRIER